MDYTVHGILQDRILDWVAIPFSRRSSQPRGRTQVSCIAGGFFISWATRICLTNLDSILKSRHYFANKGPYSQRYGFSSSHIWMWEVDHKEGWALTNWRLKTVVLEKTLESLLDCKEIKPVNPKENQSWMLNGRTDAEVEAPILWPHDVKSQLGKDPDAGKD